MFSLGMAFDPWFGIVGRITRTPLSFEGMHEARSYEKLARLICPAFEAGLLCKGI
jgi:hypothetical protein